MENSDKTTQDQAIAHEMMGRPHDDDDDDVFVPASAAPPRARPHLDEKRRARRVNCCIVLSTTLVGTRVQQAGSIKGISATMLGCSNSAASVDNSPNGPCIIKKPLYISPSDAPSHIWLHSKSRSPHRTGAQGLFILQAQAGLIAASPTSLCDAVTDDTQVLPQGTSNQHGQPSPPPPFR